MRKGIHPEVHEVLFVDVSTGHEWLSRSTRQTDEWREIDGRRVCVIRLDVSSFSHPFWTGEHRQLDREGRIERFERRFNLKKKAVT